MVSCYSCHNFLKQLTNYIKFYFPYLYTPTLEVIQFPLHKSSKHQTSEQYQGSSDRGGQDLKSELNWTASDKIRQYANIFSQCEQLSQPWTWHLLYFDFWPHFEKHPGIINPINFKQKPLQKLLCYICPYQVQDNTKGLLVIVIYSQNWEGEWLILLLL